jgi:hypothetical protein
LCIAQKIANFHAIYIKISKTIQRERQLAQKYIEQEMTREN